MLIPKLLCVTVQFNYKSNSTEINELSFKIFHSKKLYISDSIEFRIDLLKKSNENAIKTKSKKIRIVNQI